MQYAYRDGERSLHPAGDTEKPHLRVNFDRRLKLEFHGSKITPTPCRTEERVARRRETCVRSGGNRAEMGSQGRLGGSKLDPSSENAILDSKMEPVRLPLGPSLELIWGMSVYFGRVSWGIQKVWGVEPDYATALRHPVDRIVSW